MHKHSDTIYIDLHDSERFGRPLDSFVVENKDTTSTVYILQCFVCVSSIQKLVLERLLAFSSMKRT